MSVVAFYQDRSSIWRSIRTTIPRCGKEELLDGEIKQHRLLFLIHQPCRILLQLQKSCSYVSKVATWRCGTLWSAKLTYASTAGQQISRWVSKPRKFRHLLCRGSVNNQRRLILPIISFFYRTSGQAVKCCCWMADGKGVITGHENGALYKWPLKTNKPEPLHDVRDFEFSEPVRRVLSIGQKYACKSEAERCNEPLL